MTRNPPLSSTLLEIEKGKVSAQYAQSLAALEIDNGQTPFQRRRAYLQILAKRDDELFSESLTKLSKRNDEDIKKERIASFERDIIREQMKELQAQQVKLNINFEDVPVVKKAAVSSVTKPQPQETQRNLWQRAKDLVVGAYNSAPRLVAAFGSVVVAATVGLAVHDTDAVHKLRHDFNKSSIFHRAPSPLVTAVLETLSKSSTVVAPLEEDVTSDALLSSRPVFDKVAAPQEGSFLERSASSSSFFSAKILGLRGLSFK